MDDIKISFSEDELELLKTLLYHTYGGEGSDGNIVAIECYRKICEALPKGCPLVSHCQSRTAPCSVMEPDDGCYYYRYFKELIERRDKKQ